LGLLPSLLARFFPVARKQAGADNRLWFLALACAICGLNNLCAL
jgi:hypothetical protein